MSSTNRASSPENKTMNKTSGQKHSMQSSTKGLALHHTTIVKQSTSTGKNPPYN